MDANGHRFWMLGEPAAFDFSNGGIEWDDVEAKCHALMSDSGLRADRIERILSVIHGLDGMDELSELTNLLA